MTRAAGEQTAQAERELADAAQSVDDLEETLDTLRDEHSTTLAALRLDTELKTRQTALDKALKEATDAREAKAAMTGELRALKAHNEQLAALLAGKAEPAAVKVKK